MRSKLNFTVNVGIVDGMVNTIVTNEETGEGYEFVWDFDSDDPEDFDYELGSKVMDYIRDEIRKARRE